MFSQLGLNDREADAYVQLLKTGPQTASRFATVIRQPRSTTYFILERLKAAGIVEEHDSTEAKVFRAVQPRDIVSIFHLRERELEETMNEFQRLVPQLLMRQSSVSATPAVEWMDGRDAVMRLHAKGKREGNSEHDWCILFNPETLEKVVPGMLDASRYADRETRFRELVTDTPFNRTYKKEHDDGEYLQIRILPKEIRFDSNIAINGKTVHFTSVTGDAAKAMNMRVRHPMLSREFQQIFDFLWARSS